MRTGVDRRPVDDPGIKINVPQWIGLITDPDNYTRSRQHSVSRQCRFEHIGATVDGTFIVQLPVRLRYCLHILYKWLPGKPFKLLYRHPDGEYPVIFVFIRNDFVAIFLQRRLNLFVSERFGIADP
ncbi:hypothetical protein D3C87_1641550 [compost metagenome]